MPEDAQQIEDRLAQEQNAIARVFQRDAMPNLVVPVGSEIDTQVATARQYPRQLAEVTNMVRTLTLASRELAQECGYLIQRGGKKITGPSVRFAEALAYSWGNSRAGSYITSVDKRFITASGAFWDLERNFARASEVKVRIVDRDGNTYGESMIETAAGAAGAKAIRTATLRCIPRGFWMPLYEDTVRRANAKADKDEVLEDKREAAFNYAATIGVTLGQVLRALKVQKVEDVTWEKLTELRAIFVAIKDESSTVEEEFGDGLNARDRQAPRARKSPLDDAFAQSIGDAAPPTADEMERDGLTQ